MKDCQTPAALNLPRSRLRAPVYRPLPSRSTAGLAFDIRHLIVQPPVAHPSQANGLHNVVRHLMSEQQAVGDRACLYTLSPEPSGADGVSNDPLCRRLPPGPLSPMGRPMVLDAAVERLLEGAGPRTVIHLHGAVKPTFALLGHHLRRAGVAYGVTLHGQYSHIFDIDGQPRRCLGAAYLRLIDRTVLSQARFVHAITAQEASIVRAVSPAAPVRLLANAAYSRRRDGMPHQVWRPSPGEAPLIFGFCARYEIEHKGLDLLIDGFAAYRRAGGHGMLELIGTGPAGAAIAQKVTASGFQPFIQMHGPKFGAEKATIMARWHYCVLPSRFDVMPTGCLEAALSGIPLIVTRETGLAPLIEQHGAGFPISSLTAEAVAAALAQAAELRDSAWHGMASGAYAMALGIGDWGEIAAQLRSFYAAP